MAQKRKNECKNAIIVNPFTTKESKTITAQFMGLFDASKVKDIATAKSYIESTLAINNRMNFGCHKVIQQVKELKLWQDDRKFGGERFKDFFEWVEYRYGWKRSNTYNALKCAQLINKDGSRTILKHKTENDFTFTHLTRFAEHKYLSEKDPDGNKVWIMEPHKVKAYDENGIAIVKDGKQEYVNEIKFDKDGNECKDKDGNIIYIMCTRLENLCAMGELSPAMSVSECKAKLDKLASVVEEAPADEPAENSADEPAENSADEPAENSADKPALKSIQIDEVFARDILNALKGKASDESKEQFANEIRELLTAAGIEFDE